MKTFRRMVWFVALAGGGWTTSLLAQTEQWLDYHTSREGTGFRWLSTTTTAPTNVALPKLSAQGYFVRWATPMDPQGRWICFDRTRKSGPYNRVYIDSNGAGRLDDKPAVEASRVDEYSAYFDPVRVTFKGEDGPITYHLVFRFSSYNNDSVTAYISSGGSYSGSVTLNGKKHRIELIDGNANGAFNDKLPNTDCDRVILDGKGDRRFLGRLLEVDNELYRIEVARDGAFVKIQKADDIALGKVQVPEAISEITVVGEGGHFTRKPVKGELTLPVGRHNIYGWQIDRKDAKGASWQLMGHNFNQSAGFEVTAVKPTVLEVGEPVRAALDLSERGDGLSFRLNVQGRYGESVRFLRGGQTPPGPKLIMASLDGTFRSTNSFEFG